MKEAGSLESIRIVRLGTGANTREIPLSDAQEWGVEPLSDDIDDASPENIRSLQVAAEKYLAKDAQAELERFL